MCNEWQKIETASKDGTAVWVIHEGRPFIGFFQPAESDWDDSPGKWYLHAGFTRKNESRWETPRHDEVFGTYIYSVQPTHWMPLPLPPADMKKE